MQKPNDWNTAPRERFRSLQAGGYVCVIKGVEERTTKEGKPMIAVAVDIAEGEFEGYVKKAFERALKRNQNAKWPNSGMCYCLTKNEDGSTNPNFKNFVESVKESNPGFEPMWGDNFATQFKNRKIGVVYCREQYEGNDGNPRWSAKPDFGHFKSISDIKEGKYTVPEDKPLKAKPKVNTVASDNDIPEGFEIIDENEIPF